MRILYLTSRIPFPLNKGDRLRAYYQLKSLNKNHEVHLICLNDEGELSLDQKDALKEICSEYTVIDLDKVGILSRLAKAVLKRKLPYQVQYFYSNRAKGIIDRIVERFQPNHIFAQLVRTAEFVRYYNIPKTLDMMDALSQGMARRSQISNFMKRMVFKQEASRLLKYENEIADDFNNVIMISENDARIFNPLIRKNVSIIPNGIGPQFLENLHESKEHHISFVGNLGYPPNIDAAEFLAKEIFPRLLEKKKDIQLLIAGADPSKKVKNLASENITVIAGVVDIRTAYVSSKVFVAPMRIGSGLQNKLLEAMALGIPCVTTTLANLSLKAKPGEEVLLGDNAIELADKILTILNDNDLANVLIKNAKKLIEGKYRWEMVNEQIEKVILNNT